MARAYKCDICGGFYTFKNDNDVIHDTQNQLILRRSYPIGNCYDMAEEFDICPDCVRAIHNLLEERSHHETAEETDQESEGAAGEERTELERMDVGV